MKKNHFLSTRAALLLGISLACVNSAGAQTLPTAAEIAAEMTFGWNIGNTMEVPKDPTLWGNQIPTQELIDFVKSAGFNTIRIPCAWNSHANQSTYVIDVSWLAQVKAVVDYCIKDSLFVILNSHWDEGWLEENIIASSQAAVNKKQGAYWRQIATTFRDYDRHLLFAGANEPAAQDKDTVSFGADRMAVLTSYLQTFIDSVRATGGNNASRTLIIQGPKANIDLTNKRMNTLPTDKIDKRLMAEVHFYPYQFSLMTKDEEWGNMFFFWGAGNHSTTNTAHNPTWGEESYVDEQFNLMKTQFVNQGIPVILGEFGAIKRDTLYGDDLTKHLASRVSFYRYVASSSKNHGLIPILWDTGYLGAKNMTVIDRTADTVVDKNVLNGIRAVYGLPAFEPSTSISSHSKFTKPFYSATVSDGKIQAVFTSKTTEPALVTLTNMLGQIIATHRFNAQPGTNTVEFNARYHGTVILHIRQGQKSMTVPVQSK